MITLKPYNELEHYNFLKHIWDEYEWPYLPTNSLPKTGFIAINNSSVVGALFVYMDKTCDFSFIGWPLVSKKCESIVRKEILNSLTKAILDLCDKENKKLIYCFSKSDFLVGHYKKYGFNIAETNVTTLALNLQDNNIEYLKE